MRVNRRQILQLGLTGVALSALPGCTSMLRPGSRQPRSLLSAADTQAGGHTLTATDMNGTVRFSIPVSDRCHGACSHPFKAQHILFARRPGRHFYVIDGTRGEVTHTIAATDGHHFYGHGVFSPDGRYVYATMNHYEDGAGIIGVFDAERDFRQIQSFAAGGIGPHEIRLHPDGDTLIVAVGGIKTHPDYRRIKLNLSTMAPALVLINRHNGEILQQHTPSHHQLSCRHLDVGPDGVVIAGYQYQGYEWESHPLLARLDTRDGSFSELSLPDLLQSSLKNYTASIAMHAERPEFAVTAPRGGKMLILDQSDGRLLRSFDIADCAGVVADTGGGFWVSSGNGSVYQVTSSQQVATVIQKTSVRWDNHLIAV